MVLICSTISCSQHFVTSTAMAKPALLSPPPKSTNFTLKCHAEKLVSNVSERLMKPPKGITPFEELKMIDRIQRLGIDHLFRNEIREALERHHAEWYSNDGGAWCTPRDHLLEVSLRFRLLRQHGYHIPSGIFEKFTNGNGEFEQGLSNNLEGVMSLFEASHMSIQGEDILDEANGFSAKVLRSLNSNKRAENTLKLPFHKSLTKFTAMDFLHSLDYSSEAWLTELGELAKLDFDMAALSYKDEFLRFSRWWKELGLGDDLKLARDQPLKWYIWAVAAMPDPNFSEERLEIGKPISLLYIVDDLFDVYGSFDDLSLFTKAIDRWELGAIEELPEYMRSTWRAVFDTTNEISHNIWIKHGLNPKSYLQKGWADFCNACLLEARWNSLGYLPTTAEYLKIGTITSGVPMVLTHGFVLLAESLNSSVHLLNDDPRIISSVATILRLSDDLGSAEDEGQEGFDGSYVNCYLNENHNVSVDAARERVNSMIADSWKRLNGDCLYLQPHPFSASHSFGRACLNSARIVPLMYGYEHGHLPGLEKLLKLLLHEGPLNGSSIK